jgi:hypothetical protein
VEDEGDRPVRPGGGRTGQVKFLRSMFVNYLSPPPSSPAYPTAQPIFRMRVSASLFFLGLDKWASKGIIDPRDMSLLTWFRGTHR